MSKLIVNVQVDRLPSIDADDGNGTRRCALITLKASAMIADSGTIPSTAADEVLPWKWRDAERPSEVWDPHKPASWTFWAVDPVTGTFTELTSPSIEFFAAVTIPPEFDRDSNSDINGRFRDRVAAEIDSILAESGMGAALGLPDESAPTTGRTVFGLVESLATLPYPVPQAMNAITAIRFAPAPSSDDLIVAAPKFASSGGVLYDLDLTTLQPRPDILKQGATIEFKNAAGAAFPSAAVEMRASLPETALGVNPSDPQRLLDLDQMVVRLPEGHAGVEAADWLAELPGRIAETIDPYCRFIAVFDKTLSRLISLDQSAADYAMRGVLTRAFQADLKLSSPSGGRFLHAIDEIAWQVVGPRLNSSIAAAPLLAILTRASCTRRPELTTAVFERLSSAAASAPGAGPPPRETSFAAIAGGRIARLVGVPQADLLTEAASADRLEELKPALLRYWANPGEMATAAVKDGALDGFTLAARHLFIDPDRPAWPNSNTPDLAARQEALFELPRSTGSSPIVWNIALLELPNANFTFNISAVADAARAIGTVVATPETAGLRLTLSLSGTAETTDLLVPPLGDVLIKLDYAMASVGRILRGSLASGAVTSGQIHTLGIELDRSAFSVRFTCQGSDLKLGFPVLEPPTALLDDLRGTNGAAALRRELSLSYAGPYLEGIVAGRTDWTGASTRNRSPADERIQASVQALLTDGAGGRGLYSRVLNVALANAGLPPPGDPDAHLSNALSELMADAASEAIGIARTLVPGTADGQAGGNIADQARYVTENATPLVVRIDQIQAFDSAEDLWRRIAGIGFLLTRSPDVGVPPHQWYSLNAAELHAPEYRSGVRPPLNETNAIRVSAGSVGDDGSLVDPIAQQVEERGGIRSSLVTYDNRSLVVGLAHDQALGTPDNTAAVARRLEAYSATGPNGPRLPALSFGHMFHLCPYVIGPGGALPTWLRSNQLLPFERLPAAIAVSPPQTAIRQAIYRRTRSVGAPTLLPPRVLPGIPDTVVPLAGELPIRPTPVSIGGTVEGRFFLSRDGKEGVIALPKAAQGERSGLRLDIGSIVFDNGASSGDLTIVLYGRPASGANAKQLAKKDLAALPAGTRLRLDILNDGWRYAVAPEPDFAEDEPAFPAPAIDSDPDLQNLENWRSMAVFVVAKTVALTFEPPVAVFLVEAGGDLQPLDHSRQLPPETNHTRRATHVLDGISRGTGREPGRKSVELKFRRPTVDYATYERWVNAAYIENRASAAHVDKVLFKTRQIAGDEAPGEQRAFDDPAVTTLHAELVRIFPTFETLGMLQIGTELTEIADVLGFAADGKAVPAKDCRIRIEAQSKTSAEGFETDGQAVVARLAAGRSYELRIYGGVGASQDNISGIACERRLSQAVRSCMRAARLPDSRTVLLGTPMVLTFEVATDEMPEIAADDYLRVSVFRPPNVGTERAHISLSPDFTAAQYRPLRYCGTAGLVPQRWNWRGRPQDDDWSVANEDRFQMAFADRREADSSEIIPRPLLRHDIYLGRQRIAQPMNAGMIATPLFEKDLDWRGGVALWRFGAQVTSRYAAMRSGDGHFGRHFRRNGTSLYWNETLVRDRGNGRVPKRPGFALALPLTEPMMSGGAVPPLLLLFNEAFHSNFHAGDGLEVAIDISRHPFTEAERTRVSLENLEALVQKLQKAIDADPMSPDMEAKRDELARATLERDREDAHLQAIDSDPLGAASLKYWQERGRDPIRSGIGADGKLLLVRVDGPIGYSFDAGTESGRIDHTGLLVSPIDTRLSPWSMIKLRCRRLEAPEGIDETVLMSIDGLLTIDQAKAKGLKSRAPGPVALQGQTKCRVANDRSMFAEVPETDELAFATEHEGLAIDLLNIQNSQATFSIDFSGEPQPKTNGEVSVTLIPSPSDHSLTIQLTTALGPAGSHRMEFREGQQAKLRLLISLRDRPNDGKLYRPSGDVSVRLRLSAPDGIIGDATERWLSVATVPLLSSHLQPWKDSNKPVLVNISATGHAQQATVQPVRLSSFTPSVWCQFAESMSIFEAHFVENGRSGSRLATHEDISARISDVTGIETMTLSFSTDTPGALLLGLHPLDALARAESEADSSQVEEVLVAVVTRYVTDVFDRVRERPVLVKELGVDSSSAPMSLDLSRPDWPASPSDLGSAGRVRLLRLLRPKTRENGGFTLQDHKFPQDLFDPSRLAGDVDMNPPDANGVVLGMSMPIEWRRG
ncbi:hypothetical protein [Rhizobium leguminosarum]|uniref:hypothetical protein n=1 Tax=Rhizobium leguminosarum TaxID=384 RepID=UPI003F9A1542